MQSASRSVFLSKNSNLIHFSTKTVQVSPTFTNRNPRNLERLRIGYKPDGYHLEKPLKYNFWHKLELSVSQRQVTASVRHFENGEVLRVSTGEWALKKQLYSQKDTAAYVNLARVLAERCLKAGLHEMSCDIQAPNGDGKLAKFLHTLRENGVRLEEPEQFKRDNPWDLYRKEKPWEIYE